jgi:multidrug efflux pump subunit AcrB
VWLIRLAMRRPITLMVIIAALIACSFLAIARMKIDIFPNLNLPVIYVVQPYGGMDPKQLEAFLVSHYENHFLYISGIDHVESKSVQNVSVMKIVFRPDADMSDAMSQVVAQVERSRAKLPPGTVSPFILRFDAGNVPVGYITLSSQHTSIGEIVDLADERIRPIVMTVPGATTPHPFGGNTRTMVITVDPERMRAYHLSAEEVVNAVSSGNLIAPSGLVRTGAIQRIANINSNVSSAEELKRFPLRTGRGTPVTLADIATVEDDMDIPTGWALVNGRRTIFIAVSKLSDASTLAVVDKMKAALPAMREQLPEDVEVGFEFDQSVYVTEGVSGVLYEAIAGAVLTGLVVLLFLSDAASSLIVVLTIPIALLCAVVGLWLTGQTINIMTLSGLSLAVGVLVDEATVAVENIHTHLSRGANLFAGIYHACCEVVTPQLLAMLSVVFVFLPSFLMVGTTQALFVPLSLAVGLAMIASYALSNTFVPVMCGWLLKVKHAETKPSFMGGMMSAAIDAHRRVLEGVMPWRRAIIAGYLVGALMVLAMAAPSLRTEIFPLGNPRSFQLRLKAPPGTQVEVTEALTKKTLDIISSEIGKKKLDVTIAYVGTSPPNYGVSNVYIWTSGPHEAIMLVAAKHGAHIHLEELKERLRKRFAQELPDVQFTFESGDIISQIMNLGAPTPIEVDVTGANLDKDTRYAQVLLGELSKVPELRDVQIVQPLRYPTVDVRVDRDRASQLGLTVADVSRSLIPAIYSSRFLKQIWWMDDGGHSYQIQIQYPAHKMTSLSDVENVPLVSNVGSMPYVRDVASVRFGTTLGELDRYNLKRMVSITANIAGGDLGKAARSVRAAIDRAGKPPRGVKVALRGQVPILDKTMLALGSGLVLAIAAILLMLVGYFQRFRLALSVVSVIPAIMVGVVLSIHATNITLNVQSFMGCIMAIGIGVANAILIVSFAEQRRLQGSSAVEAAKDGCISRLRPVLMTSIAMIAGMIPMAMGVAEGGDRTAPLGIAVIAGLLASTATVLLVLPLIFAELQGNTSKEAPTMLPDDLTPARGNGKVEAALMVPAVVSHNEGSADETAAK